jgi:hypothetical protein
VLYRKPRLSANTIARTLPATLDAIKERLMIKSAARLFVGKPLLER